MIDRFMDFFGIFLVVLIVLLIIAGLIYFPVSLATHKACLEKGYPINTVTWNLERYCMNLDGTVTIKVQELENE